jgi:hypothetical protein
MGEERSHKDEPDFDPGAYIGREPEFEAETIPGGVASSDERVAAYDSRPGVVDEPDAPDAVGTDVQ